MNDYNRPNNIVVPITDIPIEQVDNVHNVYDSDIVYDGEVEINIPNNDHSDIMYEDEESFMKSRFINYEVMIPISASTKDISTEDQVSRCPNFDEGKQDNSHENNKISESDVDLSFLDEIDVDLIVTYLKEVASVEKSKNKERTSESLPLEKDNIAKNEKSSIKREPKYVPPSKRKNRKPKLDKDNNESKYVPPSKTKNLKTNNTRNKLYTKEYVNKLLKRIRQQFEVDIEVGKIQSSNILRQPDIVNIRKTNIIRASTCNEIRDMEERSQIQRNIHQDAKYTNVNKRNENICANKLKQIRKNKHLKTKGCFVEASNTHLQYDSVIRTKIYPSQSNTSSKHVEIKHDGPRSSNSNNVNFNYNLSSSTGKVLKAKERIKQYIKLKEQRLDKSNIQRKHYLTNDESRRQTTGNVHKNYNQFASFNEQTKKIVPNKKNNTKNREDYSGKNELKSVCTKIIDLKVDNLANQKNRKTNTDVIINDSYKICGDELIELLNKMKSPKQKSFNSSNVQLQPKLLDKQINNCVKTNRGKQESSNLKPNDKIKIENINANKKQLPIKPKHKTRGVNDYSIHQISLTSVKKTNTKLSNIKTNIIKNNNNNMQTLVNKANMKQNNEDTKTNTTLSNIKRNNNDRNTEVLINKINKNESVKSSKKRDTIIIIERDATQSIDKRLVLNKKDIFEKQAMLTNNTDPKHEILALAKKSEKLDARLDLNKIKNATNNEPNSTDTRTGDKGNRENLSEKGIKVKNINNNCFESSFQKSNPKSLNIRSNKQEDNNVKSIENINSINEQRSRSLTSVQNDNIKCSNASSNEEAKHNKTTCLTNQSNVIPKNENKHGINEPKVQNSNANQQIINVEKAGGKQPCSKSGNINSTYNKIGFLGLSEKINTISSNTSTIDNHKCEKNKNCENVTNNVLDDQKDQILENLPNVTINNIKEIENFDKNKNDTAGTLVQPQNSKTNNVTQSANLEQNTELSLHKEDSIQCNNDNYKEQTKDSKKPNEVQTFSKTDSTKNIPYNPLTQSIVSTYFNIANKLVCKKYKKMPLGIAQKELELNIHVHMGIYCKVSVIHDGWWSRIHKLHINNTTDFMVLKEIRSKCNKYANKGYAKECLLKYLQASCTLQEMSNLLKVYNGFQLNGTWCHVMEYYPLNLSQALWSECDSGLKICQIIHWSKQLIGAVNTLKKYRIIHSDIQPNHILVDNSLSTLKLCGFDNAHYERNSKQYQYLSGAKTYRAPEAILKRSHGYTIDAWAAACILFEITTKRPLFKCNMDTFAQQMSLLFNWDQKCDTDFDKLCKLRNEKFGTYVFQGPQSPISQRSVASYMIEGYKQSMHAYTIPYKDEVRLQKLGDIVTKMLVLNPCQRLPIESVFFQILTIT